MVSSAVIWADRDEEALAQEKSLEARRKAIRERLREPVVLEARGFRILVDRHDGSFRIEGRQGAVGWNSALDRRGFASIVTMHDGEEKTLLIDRVVELAVTSTSIRFRGESSQGDVPDVTFVISVTRPLVGLELSVEADATLFEGGGGVRIVDRGLWVSDADEGGALLPIGLGEWYGAKDERGFLRSLSTKSSTLSGLGLKRGDSALIVAWDSEDTAIEVRGAKTASDEFPGSRSVDVSVMLRGSARSVRLFPLARFEHRRDFGVSYRQFRTFGEPVESLRYKTSVGKRQRAFVGSAIFSSHLGDEGCDVEVHAQRLQDTLGIDRAVFLHENLNWRSPAELPAVRRCFEALRRVGFLVGFDLPELNVTDGDRGAFEDAILDLSSLKPDLMLAKPVSVTAAGSMKRGGLWSGFPTLREHYKKNGVLLGSTYLNEDQVRWCSLIQGLLDHKVRHHDGARYSPFFSIAYGSAARLEMPGGEVLEPADTDGFLQHILMSAVPRYHLPGERGGSPDQEEQPEVKSDEPLFARCDGGWGDGKGLSIEERFLKNTYEVLSPLARIAYRVPPAQHRTLDEAGLVEEMYYGYDLRIVVNRGRTPFVAEDEDFVLPPDGFWIQHPFFVAFYAKRAFGQDLEGPALFTIQSLEGKLWLRAEKVRIWHGFGPSRLRIAGKTFEVEREIETKI